LQTFDAPPDEQARKAIEQRIVSSAKNIRLRPGVECFDNDAVQEFLQAWRDLARYYKEHDDRMINIEVVGEYFEWVDVFDWMFGDENLNMKCRKEAEEVYMELHVRMDDIIEMNGRWL
jgi:hypothetical protein